MTSWRKDLPKTKRVPPVAPGPGVAQRGRGFGPVAVTSRWGTQSST
jgi:hypothetical protein